MNPSQTLSKGHLSALFSNLSKGCEKQYKPEEAQLFKILSDFYKQNMDHPQGQDFNSLQTNIKEDLGGIYEKIYSLAEEQKDRGTLRALTWGEKVTKIQNSLLTRYEKQQNDLLADKNVYICEICGFIYTGNEKPEICPICKVPNKKIAQVARSK